MSEDEFVVKRPPIQIIKTLLVVEILTCPTTAVAWPRGSLGKQPSTRDITELDVVTESIVGNAVQYREPRCHGTSNRSYG